MRGSPLFFALIITIVLGLAGIPVWMLTRPHEHPAQVKAPDSAASTTRPVDLTVTSTADAEIEIRHAGAVVWRGASTGKNLTASLTLPKTASGLELVTRVRWGATETPQAVRFQFSHDGETLADATLWGTTQAEDVIALPFSQSPTPNPRPPK